MAKQKMTTPQRGIVLCLALLFVTACSDPLPERLIQRSREAPQWFEDAKLGIFIHWGPASVPAYAAGEPLASGELIDVLLGNSSRESFPYAEWYLYALNVPGSETFKYHHAEFGSKPYTAFQPIYEQRVKESWDPQSWASLFQTVGAKYVVLVTKHHDGYTLWPSEVENPNRANWGSSQDMVGELAAAVRAKGMRFGTYYSTGLDWTFQLTAEGDLVRDVLRSAPTSESYADYVYEHMVELIDRYQPDILWADIGYPAKGRQEALFDYYFSQVPQGTVNDRWAHLDSLSTMASAPGFVELLQALGRWFMPEGGDPLQDDPARIGYKTAEYDSLPGIPPFAWEATRGLGSSFAHNSAETAKDMLSAHELVTFLVDTVAKNGNVLLNVGPDSYGQIPAIQQAPLLGLGDWMAINGEALYGTRPWERYKNNHGRELRYTRSDKALYAIVYGDIEKRFTIEQPGIDWSSVDVLGATVEQTQRHDKLLTITIDKPIESAAAVVRFRLH